MALVYIPAGLIDTFSYEYHFATINRSWDSTLDKNLNLVYRRMDGRTHNTNALCPQWAKAVGA